MEYLIIDGYNVIGNWPELKRLSAASLEDAREKLVEILAEYQAFTGKQIIIVFDAYRSKGRKETENRPGIEIRYTEHGQTADTLIESLAAQLSPRHAVGVVTSDWAQQQIVMGKGARRWSSREFRLEVHKVAGEISNAAGRTATDRPAVDLAARINEKSRQKLENIIGKNRKS
ncbi:MAG: NYN domain-containing protein [Firmicutes bacterium]|nr:NYN domain-containing protein [Bacillota bacterium]HOB35592.1 NYN domain-containing protein [Bacillota bacterium]HPZ91370.1 NYN domain-containing protein [Bacillota bacterium]HQE01967.1 NYN domain-containing protein [Bacillota bacterium]